MDLALPMGTPKSLVPVPLRPIHRPLPRVAIQAAGHKIPRMGQSTLDPGHHVIERGALTQPFPAISTGRIPASKNGLPESLLGSFFRQEIRSIDLMIHRGLTAP